MYPSSNINLRSITNGIVTDKDQYIKKYNWTKNEETHGIESNVSNTKQLLLDNQKYISFVIPSGNVNININNCNQYGIQFVFLDLRMMTRNTSNHTYNSVKFFMNNKQRLITKPSSQRYFPLKKIVIKKQNEALSYKPVTNIDRMKGFIPDHISF